MRIAFIDSYYPDFLRTLKLGNGSYQEELDKVLARQFGTADFYSREFRKLGHECIDIIANYTELQNLYDYRDDVLFAQLDDFNPDVVLVQDLSLLSAAKLEDIADGCMLVGQTSCELPDVNKVRLFQTLFTSFPHYIPKLKALGVNAVYMPLAFHESVLKPPVERDIDVSFVGGIGWQWKQGLEVLEAVAREITTFQWWGYGVEQLKADSPLRRCYKGTAWGDEMYSIYQRSKIVINRHGEIAENYANNMRMYEATGCGALLATEAADNLPELFNEAECLVYRGANEAASKIRIALGNWDDVKHRAEAGQRRTLKNHTYAHRVPKIAEVLTNAMAAT